MKIVIAPDSFKGSLSALDVAKSIQRGIRKVEAAIETILVPMADGGEGTVQSLTNASGGELVELTVHDPLFRKIRSFYGIMGDGVTAVIEMAAASGLTLLSPSERNPLKTTTFGTGELILDAMNRGCRNFIIGLGGSATNDGGCGMARALGVKFFDDEGKETGPGGGELSKIRTIDFSGTDQRIKNSVFTAACDVDNPLCGANGASAVYGPQKGASQKDVITLDTGLQHFAEIIKGQLNIEIKEVSGAGAAGGLGAGMMVFLNAGLERGISIVTRITRLAEKMTGADLVITGEGRIDFQTAFGKTPFGVMQTAKAKNIPTIALAGTLGEGYQSLYEKGFDGIFSIIDQPMSLQEAIWNASELLENTAENVVRLWLNKDLYEHTNSAPTPPLTKRGVPPAG
ncbi:MAG: glycerate kinase [Bacteroidales bacterium]|nr:glycerate kinase [Bacteroidales bacterium]